MASDKIHAALARLAEMMNAEAPVKRHWVRIGDVGVMPDGDGEIWIGDDAYTVCAGCDKCFNGRLLDK